MTDLDRAVVIDDELIAKFWERVKKTETCWLWTGRQGNGYGLIWINKGNYRAHRLAYRILIGDIPAGKVLDHVCRNPICVNPAHLEAVTQRENILRGFSIVARNATKTACPHGHPYSPKNTRFTTLGARVCHACKTLREDRQRRALGKPRHAAPVWEAVTAGVLS